jgi:RNase P protein component
MPHIGDGRDVVVRALPAAEGSTWSQLQAELRLLVTQSRTS